MDDSQADPLPPTQKEDTHVEPHTKKEKPKKKVVINDEVQVYQIIPGSTEVKLISSPPRKKRAVVAGILDIDKIISDTIEILDIYLEQFTVMKSTAQKRVYLLHSIGQSVHLYADHLEKLKNFFLQHDQIQSKWYLELCHRLPNYGDYLKVLKDTEDSIKLEGLPRPVAQTEVRKVVEGVIDNVYNGGMFVSAERGLCKTIDFKERNKLFAEYIDPLDQRSTLLNVIDDNQRIMREILSDLTTQVGFLQVEHLQPIISDFQLTPTLKKL